MKRRCDFLDCLPAFNYNTGSAEYLTNKLGVRVATDTTCLGSTLMHTMLSEVSDFCDPSIKENWSVKAHQQVCGHNTSKDHHVECLDSYLSVIKLFFSSIALVIF